MRCEKCGEVYPSQYYFKNEGKTSKLLCSKCSNSMTTEEIERFMGESKPDSEGKLEANPQEIAEKMSPAQKVSADRVLTPVSSNEISTLMKRYKDAFSVAKITVAIGTLIKIVGVVLAILIIAGGFGLADKTRNEIFGVLGLVGGIVIGIFLYFLGVLVRAQGQILRASLDSAVNTSPFLSNEQRARAMSLI